MPWNTVRDALRAWRSGKRKTPTLPDDHLLQANRNLRDLLEDTSIPASIRTALAPEFDEVERLARKLEQEEIHIAVFGRVGTGKSSLCNALLGRPAFSTSALHGETRTSDGQPWQVLEAGKVVLIDTPGIDELGGEDRSRLAEAAASRADIILFVCEADLTAVEHDALSALARRNRPMLLVLNKADRYTTGELELLLARLEERAAPLIGTGRVIAAAADPRPETVVQVDAEGRERERQRGRPADVHELRDRLWRILEAEGKTLAALGAALFASELDRQVAERVVVARKEVADRLIRKYCLGKGLAVAANPVPVADLLAAAGIDVAMVIHLGQVYGHRPSRREASRLLMTIAAQLLALMGAYWGVNLASSALKGLSAGATTVLTGAAQGALAWYATFVTGKAAEAWFAGGKDWGPGGPKATVRDILDSLDRESLLQEARRDILAALERGKG
jgi:small GTP-binding protein